MKKTMKKSLIAAGITMLGLPAVASAQIMGHCSDCHTMHNSELNAPVALQGRASAPSGTANQNLLKFDCIACHASPLTTGKTMTLPGTSVVPQVYHEFGAGDFLADNLAGGNFIFVEDSNRAGHNVSDLFPGGDMTGGTYTRPPGFRATTAHNGVFSGTYVSDTDGTVSPSSFARFTCAGSAGCHGTRSQTLSGSTDTGGVFTGVRRTGIAAISGAHHKNVDGIKTPDPASFAVAGVHSGEKVAQSYRFIRGLWGAGNPVNRWQNNAGDHNEYYGVQAATSTSCGYCHTEGTTGIGDSNRVQTDALLKVPNNSMSGFCATCHGSFHSSGENGVSGAFLRHPSDWVLPADDDKEYKNYTVWTPTAPVARPALDAYYQGNVTPGTDMVMCLSCHVAHGSPYEAMLRFDYGEVLAGATNYSGTGTSGMKAGSGTVGTGCLACHTLKGYPGSVAP